MKRISGKELSVIKPYFVLAAEQATQATCQRARCGVVIIKDKDVIGVGCNAPPRGDEAQRTCNQQWDTNKKPKYDLTCCVHAEWNAILDACKHNASKLEGSRLYFMRIDADGAFTDAGEPYCTTCSRLTMESGVGEFALWNSEGADIYDAAEYNQLSYSFYQPAD